jgi:hypothetical protein
MVAEVMLMSKVGASVAPVRIRNPEDEFTALLKIRAELDGMIQRCQSLLLTAAESLPDEEELDAIQDRLDELREQIEPKQPELAPVIE